MHIIYAMAICNSFYVCNINKPRGNMKPTSRGKCIVGVLNN